MFAQAVMADLVPFEPLTCPDSPFSAISDDPSAVRVEYAEGAPMTEQWPDIVERIVSRALSSVETRLKTIDKTASNNAGAIAGIREGLAGWRGADLGGKIDKLESRLEAEVEKRTDALAAEVGARTEALKTMGEKVAKLEAERHRAIGAFFILSLVPTGLTVATALGWFTPA